jgi:hypothetical protein
VVLDQLEDYVSAVASMYRDNPFHNFEHASHVVMSVVKLLSRIVAPDIGEETAKIWRRHFMITRTVSRPTLDAVRLCFLGTHPRRRPHWCAQHPAQLRTPRLPKCQEQECRRTELGRLVLGPLNGQ